MIVHTANKTETELAFDDFAEFLTKLTDEVIAMNLSQKKMNEIFKLMETLVRKGYQFNTRLMNDDNGMAPQRVIESTSDSTVDKLQTKNSAYKRNLMNNLNEKYVSPDDCAIGTRWELKKYVDRNFEKCSIPQNVQNQFQYVPNNKTIQSLFKSDEFIQIYFNKNTVLDHQCENGKYVHFCCGEAYKKNPFFKENPLGLQIHLASDDFEICSPLQSKSGVRNLFYDSKLTYPVFIKS